MNLLEETIKEIKKNNQKVSNIIFIGSMISGHSCSWKQFRKLADKEYDNGYGGSEVATDLIIVFKGGGRLVRQEYDGSEWWEYIEPFIFWIHNKRKEIKTLFGNDHLANCQSEEK